MTQESIDKGLLEMATDIVAAFVSNNTVQAAELPRIFTDMHKTLADIAGGEGSREKLKPAVPINKSVTDDYIVCLEDGKKLRMLKRHLRSRYDMSPEQYREKWGLPPTYPMVAPKYSERRSQLAKQIGLGTTSGKKSAKAGKPAGKRGRPKKA
jgi:predicted transcriptional regulator